MPHEPNDIAAPDGFAAKGPTDSTNAIAAISPASPRDAIRPADPSFASGYVRSLELLFRKHAKPEAAGAMEDYMKGQFPFLGLKQPERLALTRDFLKERGVPAGDELRRVAEELWELPEREFHYTAIALLEKRMKQADPSFVSLYEKLIASKSWWDTVDLLASKLAGRLFLSHPGLAREHIPLWISSDNLWLRRTALLFQLTYKEKTDAEWLFELIRTCADEKEFFIRKAIGWALREYAKSDPRAVRDFVAGTKLSPLSVREALKHIGSVS